MRTTRASATMSKFTRAQEMGGLVDSCSSGGSRPRPPTVAMTMGGFGQRHQRLAAHHLAVAADLFGERQPHHGTPAASRAVPPRRAGRLDALDQHRKVLHPWRKDLEHEAPCRLQAEGLLRRQKPVDFPPYAVSPQAGSSQKRRADADTPPA